jgi:putative transposase
VHNELMSGRTFGVLTVIDKRHRLSVALQAKFALPGKSVVDALNAVACERDLPFAIAVDHGTEFTSKVLGEWCYFRGVNSIPFALESLPKTESSSRSMGDCAMSS